MKQAAQLPNVQALAGRAPGFAFFLCSVLVLWFAAMIVLVGAMQGKLLDSTGAALMFGIFVSLFVYSIAIWRHKMRMFKTYTYAWYARTFPGHVNERGVRCRHCGSGRVSIRNLMQQTFQRAHVCNQCGETLYFSPEA